jgi:hypothetical protein
MCASHSALKCLFFSDKEPVKCLEHLHSLGFPRLNPAKVSFGLEENLVREHIFPSGEPRTDVKILTKYDEFEQK